MFCYVLNITHLLTQLNVKTVLFQTVQVSISTQFGCQTGQFDPSIVPCQVLTTPGQSEPGSDGNKGVFCIPQSSSITEASP